MAAVAACGGDEPGQPERGPAALVPGQVMFSVACGDAAPKPQMFEVINSGDEVLLVNSATATGGFVVTAALPIQLQPGATIKFSVTPPMAEVGTDRGGSFKTGKLTIATNDPNGTQEVTLRAMVLGANLEFTDAEGGEQSLVTFSPPGDGTCGPAGSVFLANTGTETVTFATAAGMHTVNLVSESADLDGGAALEFSVEPDASDACQVDSTLTFTVTGTVCIAPPELAVRQTSDGGETCFCGGSGSGV